MASIVEFVASSKIVVSVNLPSISTQSEETKAALLAKSRRLLAEFPIQLTSDGIDYGQLLVLVVADKNSADAQSQSHRHQESVHPPAPGGEGHPLGDSSAADPRQPLRRLPDARLRRRRVQLFLHETLLQRLHGRVSRPLPGPGKEGIYEKYRRRHRGAFLIFPAGARFRIGRHGDAVSTRRSGRLSDRPKLLGASG